MPCTVLNLLIATVLAVGVSIVWLPAGILSLALSVGVIYFRGYLVPRTPVLTQRYFPEWLLQALGKEPADPPPASPGSSAHANGSVSAGTARTGTDTSRADLEELLLAESIVEECVDDDDLCLNSSFEDIWWRRIRQFRADSDRAIDQLGAVLNEDPAALTVADDDQFVVRLNGKVAAKWVSDAAFYADLAAKPTLEEWCHDWEELSDRTRIAVTAGLRVFLDSCPVCETNLEHTQSLRESCCSKSHRAVSLDCPDCATTILSSTY